MRSSNGQTDFYRLQGVEGIIIVNSFDEDMMRIFLDQSGEIEYTALGSEQNSVRDGFPFHEKNMERRILRV